MENKRPPILICILCDLAGLLSYVVPIAGEAIDFVWAPISAFLFYKFFGGKLRYIGALISFVEELLPGLDFLPTFTIAWFLSAPKKEVAKQVDNSHIRD